MSRLCRLRFRREGVGLLGGVFVDREAIFHYGQSDDDGRLFIGLAQIGGLSQPGALLFFEAVTFVFEIFAKGDNFTLADVAAFEIEDQMPIFAFILIERAIDLGRVFLDYNQCFGRFFQTVT